MHEYFNVETIFNESLKEKEKEKEKNGSENPAQNL